MNDWLGENLNITYTVLSNRVCLGSLALICFPGVCQKLCCWMGTSTWDSSGGVIWLMSGSIHCRGIVMHEGRRVYCVLCFTSCPPLSLRPLVLLFSDVMEEADESLRNEMMYCCWQTRSLMLSFSLLLHSSTLSFYSCQSPLRSSLAAFACFQAPCCLSDICVVIFVPFEQMSLPFVLSNDRLFHIFSREQADADLHRTEEKPDSDWCRLVGHRDRGQTGNQRFLIDILCCARSSMVRDHYMPAFVLCSTKIEEDYKNKMA